MHILELSFNRFIPKYGSVGCKVEVEKRPSKRAPQVAGKGARAEGLDVVKQVVEDLFHEFWWELEDSGQGCWFWSITFVKAPPRVLDFVPDTFSNENDKTTG